MTGIYDVTVVECCGCDNMFSYGRLVPHDDVKKLLVEGGWAFFDYNKIYCLECFRHSAYYKELYGDKDDNSNQTAGQAGATSAT